MAEAQEKDNFWLYIAGLIVATVILVFMLKSRETEHLQDGVIAQSQSEVFANIEKRKATRNVTTGQND
ncbi:MAG: hypothetical protein CVV13_14120 [Gammaproteobacteria bacterium HGW-Gammaproteobacteria-3]|nr:MAG: hypothetical protein CVV13_14120 [Gammaproteobacteria bacterium HGW-Gammaproteobacteria-3]